MVIDRRDWYHELLTPDLIVGSRITKVLYEGTTPYQAVKILDTYGLGRSLVLDGKTQSAEAEEFVYHESLVHPVLAAHPAPATVFIGGGGEGATAREVLRHRVVQRVVMVDLDRQVVALCQQYLPGLNQGAFEDPRLELRFADAKAYLEETSERFDVVILDLADPLEGGPAYQLYTQEFYRTVRDRLRPGGMLVTQAGPASIVNYREVFTAIHHTLQSLFPIVEAYRVPMQSFGEPWGFVIASLGSDPLQLTPQDIDSRLSQRGVHSLRSYDGLSHHGLFALPKYLRQALDEEDRLITLGKPLYVF
ncbi:MAG: polyamine aminopropyltransferase [Chloroflexi bacterium]|nr:polyamine aminopropyltransferase [Chloroflexota bacterium]